MLDHIGNLWCAWMHDSLQWPIHGHYRCNACGRLYAVPWAGSPGAAAPARRTGRRPVASAILPALLAAALLTPPLRAAEPAMANAVDAAADAFARYTAAQRDNRPWRVETLEIEASLPKLAKQGRLRAIRKLLPLGRPQYEVLEITGDDMVKREVIARYLSEDARTSEIPAASVAITPDNYKFRYVGMKQAAAGIAYVFSITPRKKREGLIKGELWLDGATGNAVRQSGYLVKKTSIFVKRIDVAREIQLSGGVAETRITHLSIHTRLAGMAELTVEERPFSPASADSGAGGAGQ